MKGKRQKNKIISRLMLLIISVTLTLFAVYVAISSGARYVITDAFSINLSNYYMEVVGPTETCFESTPVETSFTVNNNDGTNFMTEDLVYTISIQEDAKWDMAVEDGETRTIIGGDINSDTPSLIITPKNDVMIEDGETVTILLTVTAPYPDVKTITLTYVNNMPTPILSITTGNWEYDASQLNVTSGTKSDSEVIINPHATQFGPYVPFEKGTYRVTITGTNLSNVNVDCAGSTGAITYSTTNVVKTATQITYNVYIPAFNSQVEFRVFANDTASSVSKIEVVGASGNNDWYSSNAIATINKNTIEEWIQPQYQLIINGTAGQWINYVEPFTIDTEGTITINVKNINTLIPAMEKTIAGTTIKIDKTPPNNFTPVITSSTKTTIATNGVTGDQGGSGVANYYFSINNGTTWVGTNSSGKYMFTGLTAGTTYYIRQLAVDNAGNETMSGILTAVTLTPYRTENVSFTVNLANCGQYQQSSSGTDNSSGLVSAAEVRATAGTSTFFQERNWTVWAGYKGVTLENEVDNYVNANYPNHVSYSATAKLTLQVNIDFNTGNTSGEASCGTWIAGQASTNDNLKSWSGGSSNNGDHNVANLRNIYSWNNGQTPNDFYISIYVRKAGSWTDARTIRYYPSNGSSFVTLEIAVSIPNPD